jgi:hypothetical protein
VRQRLSINESPLRVTAQVVRNPPTRQKEVSRKTVEVLDAGIASGMEGPVIFRREKREIGV